MLKVIKLQELKCFFCGEPIKFEINVTIGVDKGLGQMTVPYVESFFEELSPLDAEYNVKNNLVDNLYKDVMGLKIDEKGNQTFEAFDLAILRN